MHIHEEQLDTVYMLRLEGRLDAVTAPEAERAFRSAIRSEGHGVLVDLSGVEYMSSGGVRAMIMLNRGLTSKDRVLKLCGLNPFVKQVFEISNLDKVFDVYPSAADGIAAFQNA